MKISAAPPSLSTPHSKDALWDLVAGLTWTSHVWWLLARADVGQRYKRSALGQFWVTLSMAILIAALGIVYSGLFNIPINTYLPYLTVSFVMWTLIATTLNEACSTFIGAEGYIKQVALPLSTYLYRIIVRNLIVFAHNIVIVVPVFLYFGKRIDETVIYLIPGLFLVGLALVGVSLILAIVCARYRDIPQVIGTALQIAFFVTPVMFQPVQLPERVEMFLRYNPFASLLALVRDPLLGTVPPLHDWIMVAVCVLIAWIIALPLFQATRRHIVYWL